jgi:hypothetical protein
VAATDPATLQNAKPTTDNGQLQCKTDNRQRKTGQLVVPVGRLSVVGFQLMVPWRCGVKRRDDEMMPHVKVASGPLLLWRP